MKRLLVLGLVLFCSACATNNYEYGTGGIDEYDGDSRQVSQQILVGKPNRFLDAADWIWPGSLLSKLILWNKNMDSHEVSEETIESIRLYMEENDLDDVQVIVNGYRPGVQWSRLFQNREMGAFWRYTLGIISVTSYTIMPGRFFGGDHYNPYTNTVSIYSDIPAVALHEGAHAKDFNRRKYKGAYSAIYVIPGVALYHEAVASKDAVSYLRDRCELQDEKSAYKILHPAYGTYIGGAFSGLTAAPLAAIAALPGHITGRVTAAKADPKPGCAGDTNYSVKQNQASDLK